MKITCSKSNLVKGVSIVSKAVPSKTTSEQASVQNEDSNTSEDETSNDVTDDSSTDEGDKVRLVYPGYAHLNKRQTN